MNEKTLYFAYGSNLNLDQMARRCPDAEPVGRVRLDGYRLAFRRTGGGYLTKDDIKELSGIDVVEVSGRCGAGPHRRHEPARGAAAAGEQPHAQQGDRLLLECVQEEHAGAHLREAHAGGGQGRGVEAEEGPVRAKRIVCLFATNRPLFGSPGLNRAHTFWISLFPTKFPNSLFGAKFWIQMQPNCSIVALCVLNDRHMYALTVAFILGCRIVNVAD